MKCLTVKPKWADLIMSGQKRIENRSWGKEVRGEIAIHSGGPVFKILGTVKVVDVLTVDDAKSQHPEQQDYISGPLCWVLDDVKAFGTPIPAKGRLSLWETTLV